MREEGLPKKATFVQRPKAGNKGNYPGVQAERTATAKVLRPKWVGWR